MSKHLIWLCCLVGWPAAIHAGAWTLPQGKFWGKITMFQQETDEEYVGIPRPYFAEGEFRQHKAGTRLPYRENGKYDSKAVFIEGVYGVTDRLDLGLQVPYFDQVFTDDKYEIIGADPPSDSGFSDMRVFAKWRVIQKPVLFSLKTVAKMPTGEFLNVDGLIPVGEGQWDFDFVGQLGRSFWPLPLYGNIDLGYRVRMKNKEIDRDPGDEWLLNAELGYNITRWSLLVGKLEAIRSKKGIAQGIKSRSLIKRITYFSPVLMFSLSDYAVLELGVRFSLNGRNFSAGHQVTLGASTNVDILDLLGRR